MNSVHYQPGCCDTIIVDKVRPQGCFSSCGLWAEEELSCIPTGSPWSTWAHPENFRKEHLDTFLEISKVDGGDTLHLSRLSSRNFRPLEDLRRERYEKGFTCRDFMGCICGCGVKHIFSGCLIFPIACIARQCFRSCYDFLLDAPIDRGRFPLTKLAGQKNAVAAIGAFLKPFDIISCEVAGKTTRLMADLMWLGAAKAAGHAKSESAKPKEQVFEKIRENIAEYHNWHVCISYLLVTDKFRKDKVKDAEAIQNLRKKLRLLVIDICKQGDVAIDLSHKKLTALPPVMCELYPITHLNLSHNQLTTLPVEILNLGKLKSLDISHNKLEDRSLIRMLADTMHVDVKSEGNPFSE